VRLGPSLLVLLLLLPACSSGQQTAANLPEAQVVEAAGLEFSEIQRAVTRFLDAYAHSAEDIQRLERAVGGSDLQEWVYWLDIQNRGVAMEGQVSIERLRVLEVSGDFAAVGLDATVRFTLPDGGILVRRFESPMFLAKQGPGDAWVVFDAVRDGRSMQDAIALIRPAVRVTAHGLTVEVGSVFRFSAGTLVNLRLSNDSLRPVKVVPQGSSLDPGGLPLQGSATNPALAAPLGPGREVEGMIEFPELPLDQPPRTFTLGLSGPRPGDLTIALPAQPFAEQA
jgi:hypothetical protein